MVSMFINTLPSPFYEIVVGSVSSSFVDLVVIGERVEVGLKRGKLRRKKRRGRLMRVETALRYDRGKPLQIHINSREGPLTMEKKMTPLYLSYQSKGRPTNTIGSNVDINAKPVNSRRNNPRKKIDRKKINLHYPSQTNRTSILQEL
ncbi:hypothetical protein CR513_32991, partial [Mucuna pruriens]